MSLQVSNLDWFQLEGSSHLDSCQSLIYSYLMVCWLTAGMKSFILQQTRIHVCGKGQERERKSPITQALHKLLFNMICLTHWPKQITRPNSKSKGRTGSLMYYQKALQSYMAKSLDIGRCKELGPAIQSFYRSNIFSLKYIISHIEILKTR